jgi:hypothetical protein
VLAFGALLALTGGAFAVASLIDSGIDVARREGPLLVRRTALRLVAAALVVVLWPAAAEIAEEATGWSDRDDNGIDDPFTNGAHDWVDVNGGPAMAVFGTGSLAVVFGAAKAAARMKSQGGADA